MFKKVLLLILIIIIYVLLFIVVWNEDWRGSNDWFTKLMKIGIFASIGFAIYTTAKYRIFKVKK